MQRLIYLLLCLQSLLLLSPSLYAAIGRTQQNVLYQVATFSSLMQGVYEGTCTYKELMKHGDFGVGTFNDLNGEMIALDGNFYQFLASGKLIPVKPTQVAPFAQVTFFKPSIFKAMHNVQDIVELHDLVVDLLPDKNMPCAVRIDGEFSVIKMRSFRQQSKPYPPLEKPAREQAVFNVKNVKGSMIGYWFPEYWGGIAVPGIHLHFITDDKSQGGHMLELSITKAKMSLAPIEQLTVNLPDTKLFAQANLASEGICAAIRDVEGSTGKKSKKQS